MKYAWQIETLEKRVDELEAVVVHLVELIENLTEKEEEE